MDNKYRIIPIELTLDEWYDITDTIGEFECQMKQAYGNYLGKGQAMRDIGELLERLSNIREKIFEKIEEDKKLNLW